MTTMLAGAVLLVAQGAPDAHAQPPEAHGLYNCVQVPAEQPTLFRLCRSLGGFSGVAVLRSAWFRVNTKQQA